MLKFLSKWFAVVEPTYEVPMVTETYTLPAEAVGEYYRLKDAYHSAPANANDHALWAWWAHIARHVPAVAADPTAKWTAEEVRILTVKVWRKYPCNLGNQP